MAHSKSNLTPTRIVDKNGKFTTVHKKIRSLFSSSKIPPVSIPKTPSEFEYLNDFLDQTRGKQTSYVQSAEETVALVNRLVETSDGEARTKIKDHAESVISSMSHVLSRSEFPDQILEQNFSKDVPRLKRNLLSIWHADAISKETGYKDIEELEMNIRHHHHNIGDSDASQDRVTNRRYWRGISMLAVAQEDRIDWLAFHDSRAAHLDFISWIADHKDPKEVIAVIRERDVTDSDVVQRIINERGQVVGSLHDGLL